MSKRLSWITRYLVAATVVGGTMAGCGGADHSFVDGAASYFREHHGRFAELRNALLRSEYVEVRRSGSSGEVLARTSLDRPLETIDTPEGEILGNTLARLGLYSAHRDGSRIGIEIGSQLDDENHYFLSYGADSVEETGLAECTDVLQSMRCGVCSTSIEEEWWIEIMWSPRGSAGGLDECSGDESFNHPSRVAP